MQLGTAEGSMMCSSPVVLTRIRSQCNGRVSRVLLRQPKLKQKLPAILDLHLTGRLLIGMGKKLKPVQLCSDTPAHKRGIKLM